MFSVTDCVLVKQNIRATCACINVCCFYDFWLFFCKLKPFMVHEMGCFERVFDVFNIIEKVRVRNSVYYCHGIDSF